MKEIHLTSSHWCALQEGTLEPETGRHLLLHMQQEHCEQCQAFVRENLEDIATYYGEVDQLLARLSATEEPSKDEEVELLPREAEESAQKEVAESLPREAELSPTEERGDNSQAAQDEEKSWWAKLLEQLEGGVRWVLGQQVLAWGAAAALVLVVVWQQTTAPEESFRWKGSTSHSCRASLLSLEVLPPQGAPLPLHKRGGRVHPGEQIRVQLEIKGGKKKYPYLFLLGPKQKQWLQPGSTPQVKALSSKQKQHKDRVLRWDLRVTRKDKGEYLLVLVVASRGLRPPSLDLKKAGSFGPLLRQLRRGEKCRDILLPLVQRIDQQAQLDVRRIHVVSESGRKK